MVDWALSVGLIDLPFSPWAHVTLKHKDPLSGNYLAAQDACIARQILRVKQRLGQYIHR
jgi:hypothetical protein